MNTAKILTQQEERVVRAFVKGKIMKEVACQLNVSENTVKNHVQNIYDKTGIPRCLNALVSWWFQINFPEVAKTMGAVFFLVLIFIHAFTISDMNARRGRTKTIQEQLARRGARRYEPLLDDLIAA